MIGTIAHRGVALLRVSDARILDQIRAVLPLDDYVLAVISDTELVIDPARIGDLSARLAERGMAPLMKRAPGSGSDDDGPPTLPRR